MEYQIKRKIRSEPMRSRDEMIESCRFTISEWIQVHSWNIKRAMEKMVEISEKDFAAFHLELDGEKLDGEFRIDKFKNRLSFLHTPGIIEDGKYICLEILVRSDDFVIVDY